MMARRWLGRMATIGLAVTWSCAGPSPVPQAMSLARQHRDHEAVGLLRRALTARPDDVAARRLLIRLLAVDGNVPAARAEVEALAARLPEGDPSPWIELGHALELAHQFDEALAAYEVAAEQGAASPAGPLAAGQRAARWGEWELSRRWLEEAVRRGERSSDTWHTLGLVRLNLHDLDAARDAYRQGVAADPTAVHCWIGLATVALAAQDWAAALSAYDAALALRPSWADAELGRAWALSRLGRADEAARALDRATSEGAEPGAVARQRSLLGVSRP
jgi:tetratricopeptide (TPR) repeat protein